jgi:NodT family efflux transporter outer membrane factor (OMF) lipoprotein
MPVTLPFFLLMGAAAMLLTACQNRSVPDVDEVKSQLDVPLTWQTAQHTTSVQPNDSWWYRFGDPQLNRLVDSLLANNNDLAAAAFRLREAELNRALVGTNITPDPSAGLSGRTSRQLNHSTPSVRSYGSQFTLSYTVDLWGKLALMRDVAEWEATATAFDLQAIRLKLIGTALESYWRHSWYCERLRLLDKEGDRLNFFLRLARSRYEVGGGSQLEVLQAQQDIDSHENYRRSLVIQQQENQRTLSTLLAQPPSRAFPFTLRNSLDDQFEAASAPLPAVLLARRPDLQAAEHRLRSKLANIAITQKSFYPDLTISSSLGAGGSRDALKVFRDPTGDFAGNLIFPFLQFRQMALKTEISEMQYRQSVAEFRQTFYTALKEVESVLARRRYYHEESIMLQRAEQTASKATGVSEAAWKTGLISLKDVLDQQQRLLNVQQQQAENRLNRHLSEMQFFLATGGG